MAINLRNVHSVLRCSIRPLATIVSPPAQAGPELSSLPIPVTKAIAEHDGPLRPHLKIPVNPNHGLFGFFRLRTDVNSHKKPPNDGLAEYVALEPPLGANSGRSWNASELRRKSFRDLHTLWYIVLRERNLLATQAMELRRVKSATTFQTMFGEKVMHCQKSMGRIKAVLTERRNAYIQAARLRRSLRRNPVLLQRQATAPEESMLENEVVQSNNSTARGT